jgi:hypothetical protein
MAILSHRKAHGARLGRESGKENAINHEAHEVHEENKYVETSFTFR